jgi:hypothetical protein
MRIFLDIIIALGGIIVLLLAIGIFVKKDYSVAREVVINKSKSFVFNYLRLLKNQSNFNVWSSLDPAMKTEYRGTDGHEGFVSAWDSDNKNVGKGEQEILKIVDGERIDYELRFLKPFKSTSWAFITTASAEGNKTLVHWEFNGKMKYPTNLTLLFMNMEKLVGKDLATGLDNLKNILEK